MHVFTRKSALAGIGATVAATALGEGRAFAQMERRVDVHCHFGSQTWLDGVNAKGLMRSPLPSLKDWTGAKMLEAMDKAGTAVGMLSLTSPGVWMGDKADARRLARESNEYGARLASDHRGRFGLFAVLPLPDIDGSLQEIAYALDTLKADGVQLFTSYDDKYLGDPVFDPVFEELNRRHAVVFVHPASAACCKNLLPGIPDTAIEVQTDTTRAIARMIFSGASQRYPNARVIWSHAAGTLPAVNERLVLLAKDERYAKLLPNGFLDEARRFYYDTATTSNVIAMSALRKMIAPSHIVFGTDFPFRGIEDQVRALATSGVYTQSELAAIAKANTVALLPRVAALAG